MFPDEAKIILCLQSYFHSEISGMNDSKAKAMVGERLRNTFLPPLAEVRPSVLMKTTCKVSHNV